MKGIGIISEHAGDSSSPITREAKGTGGPTGKGGKKGQRQKTSQAPAQSHSPSKSTRQQTMLQQQQISVVWGGELHCSNPLQPTTYCAYWPVDSLGLTRLMAWLGTTVLNRTAACWVCVVTTDILTRIAWSSIGFSHSWFGLIKLQLSSAATILRWIRRAFCRPRYVSLVRESLQKTSLPSLTGPSLRTCSCSVWYHGSRKISATTAR